MNAQRGLSVHRTFGISLQHGHLPLPLVTLLSLFPLARAPSASFGYLALTFSSSMCTFRFHWLPCSRFFFQHGHLPLPLVTLPSLLLLARASSTFFGYPALAFAPSTGTFRFLWLPCSRFFL
jgi:hypothetical protein